MTSNIIQFAPLFDAVGATINLKSDDLSAEVIDYPKGKKTLIQDAVEEVSHYLDTKTEHDSFAIFGIAGFIDGNSNTIDKDSRRNLLEAVGLTKDGRYITQVLALQKVNKSWHSSEIPNQCSWFGKVCTHRGIVETPGKRGRKATRNPDEYHERKSNGIISREQCVTPALEALWRAIPQEVMVSTMKKKNVIHLDEIETLDYTILKDLQDKINRVMGKE